MCKDVCRLPPLSSVPTYKLLLVPPKILKASQEKTAKILEISGNHSNELAHLKKNLIIIDAVICLNLHL